MALQAAIDEALASGNQSYYECGRISCDAVECGGMKHIIAAFVLLSLFVGEPASQAAWHWVPVRDFDAISTTRKAVATTATADYRGKHLRAFVYMICYDGKMGGGGFPLFRVYVDGLDHILPRNETVKFRGPALSVAALTMDALRLTISKGNVNASVSSRMIYGNVGEIDSDFQFDGSFEATSGIHDTGYRNWQAFVRKMASGFDQGEVVIGRGIFFHELVVHFTGEGAESEFGRFLDYCKR